MSKFDILDTYKAPAKKKTKKPTKPRNPQDRIVADYEAAFGQESPNNLRMLRRLVDRVTQYAESGLIDNYTAKDGLSDMVDEAADCFESKETK